MAKRKFYKVERDGQVTNVDEDSLKYYLSQDWQVVTVGELLPRDFTIPQADEDEED